MRIGVEKINIYGSSMYLDQRRLAEARGLDPQKVVSDFLIDTRSLNPLWEDTVTMGANAAAPLLEGVDKASIGMLVVGTESSVDFGKPISTNIHGALGLSPNVRNFETKHACYSGAAALDTALNWLASGLNKGKKALVISTDFSRMHLGAKEEFVLGGVAGAVLLSDAPRVVEYELEKKGTWTTNVYDTFRPTARHEMGNNEVSLYSYLDALEGAYRDYICGAEIDTVDYDASFAFNCYHTPFPGMAFQAHRTLCNLARPRSKAEVQECFTARVVPTLAYARRVGSTYGASNFLGICGVASSKTAKPGDRISFFAYGSGAIGEFYSAKLVDGAREAVAAMKIDAALDSRREVTVAEYEQIEKTRETAIEARDFTPDFSIPKGWYDAHYKGKKRLVLRGVKDFARTYEWS